MYAVHILTFTKWIHDSSNLIVFHIFISKLLFLTYIVLLYLLLSIVL